MREPRISLRDGPSLPWRPVLILLVLIALSILGYQLLKERLYQREPSPPERVKEERAHEKPDYSKLLGRDKVTLLLLGVDVTWTREHLPTTKRSRSDTIMVVTIDLKRRYMGLLSIPRDLRVFLPEHNRYVKINTCTVLEGPRLTQRVIKREFNIHTDHIVVVKQEAIEELVDMIGGLEIYVEKDMDYEDRWGRFSVHLKKGYQTLNGKQVIGYMRFRMDEEGDLGRIRRQQQVIRELKRQLPKKLKGTDLPRLIATVYRHIRTDMKPREALLLAKFLRDYSDEITFRTATLPVKPVIIEGISYVEVTDRNEAWETIKYALKGYPPVQLLNGTEISGLARRAYLHWFKSSPYAVTSIGNAPTADHYVTLILYSEGHLQTAEEIRDYLGFGEVQALSEYLYTRLGNPSSELYISDPFLRDYTKRLNMPKYWVNVILGTDASLALGEE